VDVDVEVEVNAIVIQGRGMVHVCRLPRTHLHLQKLEMVGKGAYGAVYQGRHLATGHVVALKIINLDTEDDDVGDIQKEVSLLQQLMDSFTASDGGLGAMPNVIKYYGSLMEGPRVWIIMEYAEGGSIRTLVSVLMLMLGFTGTFADASSRVLSRSRSSTLRSLCGKCLSR
jgi:protein-serine/threonine kinase